MTLGDVGVHVIRATLHITGAVEVANAAGPLLVISDNWIKITIRLIR